MAKIPAHVRTSVRTPIVLCARRRHLPEYERDTANCDQIDRAFETRGAGKVAPVSGVFLAEGGATLANRVRARHRTVVEFLIKMVVPEDIAELDAEGIEHHVSRVTLSVFEKVVASHRND